MTYLVSELVPTGTWGANLRSLLTPSGWDRLRRWSYEQADNKCEICGQDGFSQNRKYPVECHEVWEYDDIQHTQTLKGVQALCPMCHCVKHYGRSLRVGSGYKVREHIAKVNNWSPEFVQIYEDMIFHIHALRSRYRWTVDIQDTLLRYLADGVINQKDFDTAMKKLKSGGYEVDKD